MKTVIPKTKPKPQKPQPKTPGPYDPQNPYKEPQSDSKDITGKDIEKDLIENDPSKGSQTDIDTDKSNEAQSAAFETISPEKDNPVRKEFEIGQPGREEIKNDDLGRDEIDNDEFNRDEWSGNFLMYLYFHANTLMGKTSLATAPIS